MLLNKKKMETAACNIPRKMRIEGKAETASYGMGVNGGKVVDEDELTIGIEDEMKEHSVDAETGKKIAIDHLIEEDPRYYTKLAQSKIGKDSAIK